MIRTYSKKPSVLNEIYLQIFVTKYLIYEVFDPSGKIPLSSY